MCGCISNFNLFFAGKFASAYCSVKTIHRYVSTFERHQRFTNINRSIHFTEAILIALIASNAQGKKTSDVTDISIIIAPHSTQYIET